jgi:glyoxylase-like metal-dependent hydrolase (beta-lactamase superfamily II)
MKVYASLLLAGVLSASLVCAENLTQKNVEKAQAIIEAAVEAHGGPEKLESVNSIVVEHETEIVATGQSRHAAPPWDRNPQAGIDAIDLENAVFVTRNHGTGGGFEFNNATVINAEESYQINYRAGTAAPIAEPDFDTTSGPFIRVTPALLVRQLSEHSRTAHFLGEAKVDGRTHDVVAFSMEVGPAISLYFDQETHRLHRSERVLPNFGLVEYRFSDYKSIDGIPFNQKFELFLNGDENMVRKNFNTKVNESFDDLTEVDSKLELAAAVTPDPLSRQQIDEGIYLIGGTGTYAMFVEMDEYVVAVGGTAGIPDRIESLREVVPEKPIKFGVITHHHFDHVLGVPVYESEGAAVIAATAHESVVRDAAEDGESLMLKTIDDRYTIEDKNRRVEVIDIGPTAHTEHLLVAWLPEEGILFEADHFALPANGSIPPAVSSTKTFAGALIEHGIDPAKMLSAHSPRVGTMKDLQAALDKEVVTVGSK